MPADVSPCSPASLARPNSARTIGVQRRSLLASALALVIGFVVGPESAAAQPRGIVRESIRENGQSRTQYLFVPESVPAERPLPLVLLLHAVSDGRTLTEAWRPLAQRHRFILLAPNTASSPGWTMRNDGPDVLHALIERVRSAHAVDAGRIYAFGVGEGGTHALGVAVLQAQYFAAVAIQGGILQQKLLAFAERARRRLPIAIWMATRDDEFPVPAIRQTHEVLARLGFPVMLTTVPGRPRLYDRSDLSEVWSFLEAHRLTTDPVYIRYTVQ